MAKFLSVDPSTNSFAFALWEGNRLAMHGKINFVGTNPLEKAMDAACKVYELIKTLDVEHVVIESPIFANSATVAITLGVAQGVMIGAIRLAGVTKVYNVSPLTWQSFIGNKIFTKGEKLQIRKDYPGKTQSWYKNFERNLRKQKTMTVVNGTYGTNITDNDVADAVGIGMYAHGSMFGAKLAKPAPKTKPVKRTKRA